MTEQTRERMETLVLVTVVTVLVWLFAEGEVVQPWEQEINVRFVSADPQQPLVIERVVGPAQGNPSPVVERAGRTMTVRLSLRGSAGQQQQLQREVLSRPIEIAVGDPTGPAGQQQVIDLEERLKQTEIGRLGVNIQGADPETVRLRVEPLERVTLPVEVRVDSRRLAEPPRAEPSEVTVQVPARVASQLRDVTVIAEIDAARLLEVAAGGTHTFNNVSLRLPPWLNNRDHVSLMRQTVAVTVTRDEQVERARLVLDDVPVHVTASWEVLEQFKLTLPQQHRRIERLALTGPASVIDTVNQRIDQGEMPVRAEITPTFEQLRAGKRTYELRIDRPGELSVEGAPGSVTLQIESR